MAVIFRHIHHVQREYRRITEFQHLCRIIKIALKIGRIDHHYDEGWRGKFLEAMQQYIAGNLFIQRLRAEAMPSPANPAP